MAAAHCAYPNDCHSDLSFRFIFNYILTCISCYCQGTSLLVGGSAILPVIKTAFAGKRRFTAALFMPHQIPVYRAVAGLHQMASPGGSWH